MLRKYMVSLGYSEDDVNKIRNTYPVIRCGDEYLCAAVKELFDVLLKFGYTKNQIIKLTLLRPHILVFGIDVIIEKLDYYVNLLGNKKNVIKVSLDFPTIFSYGIESVDDKIENLRKIGYEDDVIIKGIKVYPGILGLSVENTIKKMINELVGLGFNKIDVLKITSKNMSIFGRDIRSIEKTILKLESYGYSRKDVLSMIRRFPSLLNFSISRLEQRINEMVTLGIDLSGVLNIMMITPSLFGNDMDMIIEKKEFYDSIGLVNLFTDSPKDLMQGISKSYARYMYFLSIGIDILACKDGYKMLFIGEKRFSNKYKVETTDLVLKYDVNEYMRDIKTKRID